VNIEYTQIRPLQKANRGRFVQFSRAQTMIWAFTPGTYIFRFKKGHQPMYFLSSVHSLKGTIGEDVVQWRKLLIMKACGPRKDSEHDVLFNV
jgi:hypothetical protein